MWCVLLLLCLVVANKRTGRHQIALTIQMCNLCRLTSSPGSGLRWQTMTSTIWCVWQLFIVPQTKRKLLQTDRCLCWICWPPQWMPLNVIILQLCEQPLWQFQTPFLLTNSTLGDLVSKQFWAETNFVPRLACSNNNTDNNNNSSYSNMRHMFVVDKYRV